MALVPQYILILFVVILVDYFSAIKIENSSGKLRKTYLVLSLISNISILCFFKYFNFFNQNISEVFSFIGINFEPYNLDIILPIGLSFHTFQSMSYTIEVYRGNQKAEKHLGYFSNYVLFFPQMVAGPIERYSTLGSELRTEHKPIYENFANGFRLILFGLFIKMVVADNIAPLVNSVYDSPQDYSSQNILISIFLFSFQIYADFFGYSTIAIGAASMLGVKIINNFNSPYLSKNIGEFWQRWHISLGTWFRDYLYIPLGGNKVGLPRWVINTLIVFLISGLWHGASWTFVMWGFLHGLMLVFERFIMLYVKVSKNFIIRILLTLKTFFVVSLIWVFFRAENFEKAKLIFHSLLYNGTNSNKELNYGCIFFFVFLLILSDVFFRKSRIDVWLSDKNIAFRWSVYSLLIFCMMALSGVENYPFIYFQF